MHIFPDIKIILLQLIPFFVLMIALNALVFQPMLNYLEERRKRIEGVGERAKTMGSSSEAKAKEIETRMAAARTSVAETRARILRDAQNQDRQIMEQARKSAEATAETFRRELEQTRTTESASLRKDVDALGSEIASRVLGRAV